MDLNLQLLLLGNNQGKLYQGNSLHIWIYFLKRYIYPEKQQQSMDFNHFWSLCVGVHEETISLWRHDIKRFSRY